MKEHKRHNIIKDQVQHNSNTSTKSLVKEFKYKTLGTYTKSHLHHQVILQAFLHPC